MAQDDKFDKFAGKAKETAGKFTDDKDLEAEGKVQGAEGKAKEFVDDVKANAGALKDRVEQEINDRKGK
ncbi:MAG: CsbD family protein [Ancrocorticia sp.]|uniref:CsbD family protein n=1 Tax=Ancrocorticia sp. TaxID=2593684 RepID=UPI003F8DE1B5